MSWVKMKMELNPLFTILAFPLIGNLLLKKATVCFNFYFFTSNFHISYLVMTRWPIIFFFVNSNDSWGRSKVEGYGFCEIPKIPGFHEIKVRTWKPKMTIDDQINSFFIGFLFFFLYGTEQKFSIF